MNGLVWLVPFLLAWLVLFVFAVWHDWQRGARHRAQGNYYMQDQKEEGNGEA